MGIVSPGEPFHVVTAGKDWLMNWYDVREHAIVVCRTGSQDLDRSHHALGIEGVHPRICQAFSRARTR